LLANALGLGLSLKEERSFGERKLLADFRKRQLADVRGRSPLVLASDSLLVLNLDFSELPQTKQEKYETGRNAQRNNGAKTRAASCEPLAVEDDNQVWDQPEVFNA
jgi:hypothetical protein